MRTNLIKTVTIYEDKPKVSSKEDGKHDMVIAFDTTGSMSAYLNDVKKHVKKLIPELLGANPNMRIGVVAFGDYCDMISPGNFGNAYQVCPLTNNANHLIDFINTARKTSGGDWDEFYELVIKKIVEETDWREDTVKSVLLIADAIPHYVGYNYINYVVNNQIDWKQEAKKAAEKGIQFDTLSLTGATWYKELSEITDGVYAEFQSSNKTAEAVKVAAYSRGGDYTKSLFIDTVKSYASMDGLDCEMKEMASAFYTKAGVTEDDLK